MTGTTAFRLIYDKTNHSAQTTININTQTSSKVVRDTDSCPNMVITARAIRLAIRHVQIRKPIHICKTTQNIPRM